MISLKAGELRLKRPTHSNLKDSLTLPQWEVNLASKAKMPLYPQVKPLLDYIEQKAETTAFLPSRDHPL